jgi:CRP-like cAMP-binding protein
VQFDWHTLGIELFHLKAEPRALVPFGYQCLEEYPRGSRCSLHVHRFRNTLLAALNPETVSRLRLNPLKLELMHEIEFPGTPIDQLFFIEEGMASMTTTFKDGSQVEVGTFGYESVIGISALMGAKLGLNRIYMQIAGHGYSCPIENASNVFHSCSDFQTLALQSVQSQLIYTEQTAGCNAKHLIEQRLARWLLICADRANSNTYSISHDLLADMLGSTRPTVSLAAGLLKQQKLITYSRNSIRILDVAGLEAKACECYRLVKDYLDNKVEFESGVPPM